MPSPNILFLMCDQFRFDCISSLGNDQVKTPNIDRLVKEGVVFDNAYSTCPVCMAARYTLRTGREPHTTSCYSNAAPSPMDGLSSNMEERCGRFLPKEMADLGYRTFGIGKFHTSPFFLPVGFEVQLNTEEMWENEEQRKKDAYYSFIRKEHPEYAHIEQLHGERTNMYYVPQTSALPASLTVESFVTDRAIEQIQQTSSKPYFGFVSFIGPHPPFAPPVPYNRMYNPDNMPTPTKGDPQTDLMDEQLTYMNYAIWAEDINDHLAQNLRAHYYGEITYIDHCIGNILNAIEKKGELDNTVICFFSDHGDHFGDHHAWQKESYFEASTRVPFVLFAPKFFPHQRSHQLACITDLFGIATQLGGKQQLRDGAPLLDALQDSSLEREYLFAVYEKPGTPFFKIMCRWKDLKYIYFSNGGKEQLFHLKADPQELHNLSISNSEQCKVLYKKCVSYCKRPGLMQALDGDSLKSFPYFERPKERIRQFDESSGIQDFILK